MNQTGKKKWFGMVWFRNWSVLVWFGKISNRFKLFNLKIYLQIKSYSPLIISKERVLHFYFYFSCWWMISYVDILVLAIRTSVRKSIYTLFEKDKESNDQTSIEFRSIWSKLIKVFTCFKSFSFFFKLFTYKLTNFRNDSHFFGQNKLI